jgi:hypothetical protein
LGCAIAGVSAIVLAAIAPQEPMARAIAGIEKTGVSPLASGPIEIRSASIYQRKRKPCVVVRVGDACALTRLHRRGRAFRPQASLGDGDGILWWD